MTSDKEFLKWIRRQPCVECSGFTFWNEQKGYGTNDASHVLTKGAGNREYGNIVPHCRTCHRKHEDRIKSDKLLLKKTAQEYFYKYISEVQHELDSLKESIEL